MSTSVMCAICGLKVFADASGDNKLRALNTGDSDCKAPYWYVYRQTGRSGPKTFVANFFQTLGIGDPVKGRVPDKTPAQRAKALAATRPDYHAKQITPHGHQQRR